MINYIFLIHGIHQLYWHVLTTITGVDFGDLKDSFNPHNAMLTNVFSSVILSNGVWSTEKYSKSIPPKICLPGLSIIRIYLQAQR